MGVIEPSFRASSRSNCLEINDINKGSRDKLICGDSVIELDIKKNYGTELIFKLPEIIQKSEQTRLERYGHVNPAHGINEKKVKETMIERYGVEHATQNEEIKQKDAFYKIEYEKHGCAGFCFKNVHAHCFESGTGIKLDYGVGGGFNE